MFYIEKVLGAEHEHPATKRDEVEGWGERGGYSSRREAAEDLITERPVGSFRIVEERE